MNSTASRLEGEAGQPLRRGLERLEALGREFNAEDLSRRAALAREPLERGEIWVVVVGQFKRGKSTLLNALLGKAVLPAGMIPVTSVVTTLRWAPEEGIRVFYKDGTESTDLSSALVEFVSEEGNPGNRRGVDHVEVGIPAPLLKDGLVLVDTPGVGSLDAAATNRAYAFLPRVDAALLVLSPDPPMGEAEGVYLRALLDHTSHLLFILNKVDLYSKEEGQEAVQFNRRELARIREVPPDDVEIIPVSSKRGLTGEEGGIEKLRQELLNLVRGRGNEVAEDAALRRLKAIAGEIRARLRVEEQAIRLTDANLKDRLSGLSELRRELALRREEVRPVLLDATRRLVEGATTSLRACAEEAQEPLVQAVLELVDGRRELGNAAMVRHLSDVLTHGVTQAFEAWWRESGEALRERLREAMGRAAGGVDATGSTLSMWVEKELGVSLPTPPPPLDLMDSHDFYYQVQGMKPELTLDLLGLLVPKPLFRWRLRRKAPRMVEGDLDRNVGRIRGDILYRAQETTRAFFSELESRAVAAEDGIERALIRASRIQEGEREEGASVLNRLALGEEALEEILGRVAGSDREPVHSGNRMQSEDARPRRDGP